MKKGIILLFLSISCWAYAGEILIATVAQVKNHVITSREVQIHHFLDKALGNPKDFFKDKNPVEQIIREWLLYFEAMAFFNSKMSSLEVNNKVNKVQIKLDKMQAWQKLGVSHNELKSMVERRMEAERLYVFKKKASVLPVSAADVEAEYTQNRIRYGNFKFEEVKDKIRQKKIQENLENRLSQWFQVLEKKYRVQRFTNYSNDKEN